MWEWGNYVGCPLAPLLNRDAASPRRYNCVKAICAVRSLKCNYVLEARLYDHDNFKRPQQYLAFYVM